MIFRRKKKDEEEKEDNKKKGSSSGSKERKKRKKKKEAFKPWTKKERTLVFAVLATTVILSGALAMSARSWKLPNLPRLSLPSFNFLQGETIYLEGDIETYEKTKKALAEFKKETDKLTGVYGFYVVRLNNGSSYGANETETFQAASLMKLPVIVAMYMEAENGALDLDEKYELKASDKVAGSGSLYGKPEGFTLTYRELIEYMGKQSDNTAYRVALNLLGEEKVRTVINEIGLINTNFDENETTPEDIGLLFEKLMMGDLVSEESRDELLSFLTDTIYEEWLAAGIPADIGVAHKYGREVHVVNDGGIVFSDDPFILVILSKGVVGREADDAFPNLARIIYQVEAE